MNIFLRGAYNSYNFGDDLILIAVLKFLEHLFEYDQATIFVQKNRNSLRDLNYKHDLNVRFGLDVYSGIEFINENIKKTLITRPLRYALFSIYITALLGSIFLFRLTRCKLAFKPFLSFYENLDVIHYVGGGYITDQWKHRVISEFLTVFIAKLIKPEIIIIGTGMGIGPFKSPLFKIIFKSYISRFDSIFLREEASLKLARQFAKADPVACLGDDVLLLLPLLKEARAQTHQKLAVNLKAYPNYDYKDLGDVLIDCIHACKEYNLESAFFAFGQKPGPDDESIINLVPGLEQSVNEFHNPYVQGWEKFIRNLCSVRCGIGFAYHFCILLTICSIPCISIYCDNYYKQKIKGVLHLLGSDLITSASELAAMNKKELFHHLEGPLNNVTKINEMYNAMHMAYKEVYQKIAVQIANQGAL